MCFGEAPEVRFVYDGVEHVNDTRSCVYTPLKGVVSWQENAEDWRALANAYGRAVRALEARRSTPTTTSHGAPERRETDEESK